MTSQLGLHVHLGSTWAVGSAIKTSTSTPSIFQGRQLPSRHQPQLLPSAKTDSCHQDINFNSSHLPRQTAAIKTSTSTSSICQDRLPSRHQLQPLPSAKTDNMRRTRRHEDRQPSHQTNFGFCSGRLASSKMDRLKKRAPCNRRAC